MLKKYRNLLMKLFADVHKDKISGDKYRVNLEGEQAVTTGMMEALLADVGFQSMVAIRLMRLVRDSGIPKGGEVFSRLIRYVYGMEIHWNAEIDSGTVIRFGPGLVISRFASVGPGCVLSQHVTLGEMRDPNSKVTGAPTLGKDVYVGPGAILLGPITIGEGAHIEAGCVVTESVPPRTRVISSRPEAVVRKRRTG